MNALENPSRWQPPNTNANRMLYPRPNNQTTPNAVFSSQSFTLLNDIYLNLAVQLLLINTVQQQVENQQRPPQNCQHHCHPQHHQNHYQYRHAQQQQNCPTQPPNVFDQHIANVTDLLQQLQQLRENQQIYNNCMQLYSHYMHDVANNINDYFIMREVHLYNGRILEKHNDYFIVEDANQNRHIILRNV